MAMATESPVKTNGAATEPQKADSRPRFRVEIFPAKYDFPPMLKLLLPLPALALLLWGCDDSKSESTEPEPTVHFETPAMNATVGANVLVKLSTTHFRFSGAAAKTSAAAHADSAVGHIHLFLDMPAGLDVDAIAQLSKSDTVTLTGLSAGKHYLIAEGADAVHDDIESMTDSVAFTVAVP
jgi:hypothetical protein